MGYMDDLYRKQNPYLVGMPNVTGGPQMTPAFGTQQPSYNSQLEMMAKMQEMQNMGMPSMPQQSTAPMTPPPVETPPTPTEQPSGLMGLLGKAGDWMDNNSTLLNKLGAGYFALHQDPNLQKFGMQQIGQIKALDTQNKTLERLNQIGTPAAKKAAEYIKATGDAKGGMQLYAQYGSVVQGSGSDLATKYGLTGLDPKKPYNYDTMTGKVTGIGGGDTNIQVDAGTKETQKLVADYVMSGRKGFMDTGVQAGNIANSYARILTTMDTLDTGKFAENKQAVRRFLEGVGLDSFINLDAYTDSEQMIAATNQLVAEELRKNKGPQTDFDAIFASSYLPSLGKGKDTNLAIAKYAMSLANLDQILGSAASEIDPFASDARQQMDALNRSRMNFSAFVQTADGKPAYFADFYKQGRAKGMSGPQVIEAWTEFTERQRKYLQ